MRMDPGFIKVNYCFVVFSVLFQSQQIFVPHFNYPWLLVIVMLILPFCIFEAHFFQKLLKHWFLSLWQIFLVYFLWSRISSWSIIDEWYDKWHTDQSCPLVFLYVTPCNAWQGTQILCQHLIFHTHSRFAIQ